MQEYLARMQAQLDAMEAQHQQVQCCVVVFVARARTRVTAAAARYALNRTPAICVHNTN